MRKLLIGSLFAIVLLLIPSQSKAQSFTCDNKSGCQYTPPPGCTGAACNPQWIQDGGKLLSDTEEDLENTLDYLASEGFQFMFPPIDYFRTGTEMEWDPYDEYVRAVLGGGDEEWSMF